MITIEAMDGMTPRDRRTQMVGRTFIPTNKFHIPAGYYSDWELLRILVDRRNRPQSIRFILDMVE